MGVELELPHVLLGCLVLVGVVAIQQMCDPQIYWKLVVSVQQMHFIAKEAVDSLHLVAAVAVDNHLWDVTSTRSAAAWKKTGVAEYLIAIGVLADDVNLLCHSC